MKFNRIFPIILAGGALLAASTSCEDMMDTDSNAYVFDKDHTLNSANDSLYSAMGILTQMQQLGERYVMLGELRGDLVSVPATASIDYQNLSSFNAIGEGSPLLSRREFYAVVNNCNVALTRMDTSIEEHGNRLMLPEYAAIMSMRSWTLLQAALAYGSVSYLTEPLLDVESVEKQFPKTTLDELVPKLIADLEPYATVIPPNYGTIDGQASSNFFIRPALLLGDLYLYNGNYTQAAQMYYNVIRDGSYVLRYTNGNRWNTSVRDEATVYHRDTYNNENVVMIPYASDAKKYHPNLVNLTYNNRPSMIPAEWFVNEMSVATHYHAENVSLQNITGYLEGDLRGMLTDREGKITQSSFGYTLEPGTTNDLCLIMKFRNSGQENSSVTNPNNGLLADGASAIITRNVNIYRIPHLVLRYAEAVNRAGKPTLALAALKYGLRGEVLDNPDKVDPEELADGVEWTNFSDSRFNDSYGSAMRGRGLGVALEPTLLVLPETLTEENEKIDWVEERILEEMAAETCFEGNRFFDLLRISHHRAGHPSFMAQKIARRFSNPSAIEAKLSNLNELWVK